MEFQKALQLNLLLFEALICFNLFIFGAILKYQSLKRKISLMVIELATALLLLADFAAYTFRGDVSNLGFWMVRISNFIVFAFVYIDLLAVNVYLQTFVEEVHKGKFKRIMWIRYMSLLGLVLVVSSQFFGFLYSFDANNCYQRGPFFLWCFFAPLIIYVLILSIIVEFRTIFPKTIYYALLIFAALPLIASAAQAVFYGWSFLNLSIGFSVIVLFGLSLIDQNMLLAQTAATEKFTGLPNSYGYIQILGKKMAKRQHQNYNAMYFDLVKMGFINKKYGNDLADKIIVKYAHTLRGLMQEDEVLGRLGGNYFVALVRKENTSQFLDWLAGIDISIYNPEEERETQVRIKAIAGIYEIKKEDKAPGDILNNICTVGNIAKQEKHVPYLYLTPELIREIEERRKLQEKIRKGVDAHEFVPYYQPKVDISTRQLCGAEALVRWEHHGQLIPPYKFIPLLEQNDRICEFDFYMLNAVCSDISKWLKEGLHPPVISVNFSRKNLGNPILAEEIYNVIKSYDVPRELVQIEITETIDEYPLSYLQGVVNKLKEYDIAVAIDDFGTGSSSIDLIKKVPFDVLKIDKAFIDSDEDKDLKILECIVTMANVLGATTVVEGVESKEQVKMLEYMKCDAIQGYYFDKPLPKHEFEKRIKNPQYEMEKLADASMEEGKTKFYREHVLDRRGQAAAHTALCNLYTKILKVNLTTDTYQIVNMDMDEQSESKGYAMSISEWLRNFGKSGQVYHEDLEGYLEKTDLEFMKEYFRQGNSTLLVSYRRRIGDEFKPSVMEMILADDYSEDNQTLFLYVRSVHAVPNKNEF